MPDFQQETFNANENEIKKKAYYQSFPVQNLQISSSPTAVITKWAQVLGQYPKPWEQLCIMLTQKQYTRDIYQLLTLLHVKVVSVFTMGAMGAGWWIVEWIFRWGRSKDLQRSPVRYVAIKCYIFECAMSHVYWVMNRWGEKEG